jgi:hypothetical protein
MASRAAPRRDFSYNAANNSDALAVVLSSSAAFFINNFSPDAAIERNPDSHETITELLKSERSSRHKLSAATWHHCRRSTVKQ